MEVRGGVSSAHHGHLLVLDVSEERRHRRLLSEMSQTSGKWDEQHVAVTQRHNASQTQMLIMLRLMCEGM